MVVPLPLLAHASGFSWDEALLVMAPLVVVGALLWMANRRASRLDHDVDDADEVDDAGQPTG